MIGPASRSLTPLDRRLLRLVPADARVVVDLGCGDGRRGEAYRRVNPRSQYIGVEADPSLAAHAQRRLSSVVLDEPTRVDLSRLGLTPGLVDCLIWGPAPMGGWALSESVLSRHAGWLSPRGVLIAGLPGEEEDGSRHPNAGESGTAPTAPQPAAARAHATFDQAGLRIVHLGPVEAPEATPEGLPATQWASALTPSGRRYTIVQAVPRAVPFRRVLVQTLTLRPVAAVNDVRVHGPNTLLATLPGVRIVTEVGAADLRAGRPGEGKVFIWQRPILTRPASIETLRRLRRSGYLIVVEFDDDPRHWPQIPASDYLTFRGAHCVQTSTDALGTFLSAFNPNVAVFPNQVLELPPARPARSAQRPLTILFGALNREQDWQPIMPALNRVLMDYGSRVEVRVIHDRAFFDALLTDRKSFEPTCPYTRYLQLLDGADVGLLPLRRTEFNRLKSDVKFLEHAAHGVVALASPTVYEGTIRDGDTGLLFRSPEELEARLRSLIDDMGLRRSLADRAYAWVRDYRLLSQHIRGRYDWYCRMLDNRPRLEAELRERVPEAFD